ncbi:MAG: septum formation initiator family protein [Gemmatimonadota bacterium]
MTPLRWVGAGLVLVMVGFAIQGGSFTTRDWLSLRRDAGREREAVADLKSAIDSLEKVAARVEHDPAEQERIAREEFGMIKEGEYLYRLVPDTTSDR